MMAVCILDCYDIISRPHLYDTPRDGKWYERLQICIRLLTFLDI